MIWGCSTVRILEKITWQVRASEIDSYSASARASIPRESEEALDIGFVKEMSILEKQLNIKFAIAESKSRSGKTRFFLKLDPQIIDFP